MGTYSDYIDLLEWSLDHIQKARHTNAENGNKYAHEELTEAIKRLTEARDALEQPFEKEPE